mmetsp:Transcript_89322/g.232875  ORF Transcript_89322/g.232875 Transcript_89322/m.232875 type:complete len:80 (+) Transcript_89322:151-390(+)
MFLSFSRARDDDREESFLEWLVQYPRCRCSSSTPGRADTSRCHPFWCLGTAVHSDSLFVLIGPLFLLSWRSFSVLVRVR